MNSFQINVKVLVLALTAMWACTPQDSEYKELYDGAIGVDYPQMAFNLTVEAGYQTAKLSWDAPVSPTCKEAVVYWNNKADSLVVNLADQKNKSDRRVSVVLDDLPEGDYTFEVVIKDSVGNCSRASQVLASVVGPSIFASLANRMVNAASLSEINNAAVVQWGDKTNQSVYSEFRYYNNEGRQTTVKVGNSDNKTIIKDLDMVDIKDFEYRTVFVVPSIPDTLYSDWDKGKWKVDSDYSSKLEDGVECITFSGSKNVAVRKDETGTEFTFDCRTDARVLTNPSKAPIPGTVFVFQYKQTIKTTKVRVYWIDEGGAATSGRFTDIDTSEYAYGTDDWNVAVIDISDFITKHSWTGKAGDTVRIDISTESGNFITVRNAHLREKRDGE